jgi:hypothetical protein
LVAVKTAPIVIVIISAPVTTTPAANTVSSRYSYAPTFSKMNFLPEPVDESLSIYRQESYRDDPALYYCLLVSAYVLTAIFELGHLNRFSTWNYYQISRVRKQFYLFRLWCYGYRTENGRLVH